MSRDPAEAAPYGYSVSGTLSSPLRVIRLCGAHDTSLPAIPAGCCLITLCVDRWFSALSPWAAPPVFGDEPFGGRGAETLAYLTDTLLPALDASADTPGTYLLAGYSLAGLFALWAGYASDRFAGIAAVSPSVWFPDWEAYADSHRMQAGKVYLSLGTREEKTRHPVLCRVGGTIRRQQQLLESAGTDCVLEWNPGNHFRDSALRTMKGIDWLCARFSE